MVLKKLGSLFKMNVGISPEDVLVRAQDTPNPYAIKFVVNHALKEVGKATFNSVEECRDLPLVESVLNINGVKQVYLFENTLTVTHDGSVPIEDLKDCVTAVLKTRLSIHNPNFQTDIEKENSQTHSPALGKKEHKDPFLNAVEEVLDRTIRPGLQADGGDVEIISYKDGELRILYQGACGGCPSAMMGTLDAIQNILRTELDVPDLYVIPI
ncbi:MAG: NifU family protein [Bdellovibrionales bacterium]|nr:NifU family protein [Bdellovibrionales bacterium]